MLCDGNEVTVRLRGGLVRVSSRKTLNQALVTAGIVIESPCGGRGTCGQCAVQIQKHCPRPSEADRQHLDRELLADGWRLGCQHRPVDGMGIPEIGVDLPHRQMLNQAKPETLSAGLLRRWSPDGWLIDSQAAPFGIAIDLGTTTVTVQLTHLYTAEEMASATITNPQMSFGADIMSRIKAAAHGQADTLREMVLRSLSSSVDCLLKKAAIAPRQIAGISVVGNAAMHHLFLGLSVENLGAAPYRPATTETQLLPARKAGLHGLVNATLFCPPLIWGFVGSDITVGMLATSMGLKEEVAFLVDMGTNSEIVCHAHGKLLACAAAAGPAFEGAHTSCGMRATRGAVTAVRLTPEPQLEVIGGCRPKGLTGSGILDLLAEGLRSRLIEPSGRICRDPPPRYSSLLNKNEEGQTRITVAPGVSLTQKDIRQLQMAKGAICAGIKMALEHLKLTPQEVDRIYLAGAFGNHLDPESAARIGLFGDIPREKIIPAGNTACRGAKLTLLSSATREQLEAYRKNTEYLELATVSDFQQVLVKSLQFE